MITLFRSKFKIRILYKSGNSQDGWFTKFTVYRGKFYWTAVGSTTPILMEVDEIEAVYQIATRVNWFRAIGIWRYEMK